MSEQTPQSTSGSTPDFKEWIAAWPAIRRQVEERLAMHAQRDPSLNFELALAELELKDIDESVRRMGALGKILYGDDLSSAERQFIGD